LTSPSPLAAPAGRRLAAAVVGLFGRTPAERKAALAAFLCFFSVMAGYYALRPVRDVIGSEGGPRELAQNFTGTFVVTLLLTPLYGAAVARFDRAKFLRVAYRFFALALVAWAGVFATVDVAHSEPLRRAYFVWISAYALFLTSIFWSAMSDAFRPDMGRRLFGAIVAGATAGSIVGPLLTASFASAPALKAHAAPLALLCSALATAAGARLAGVARRAAAAAAAESPGAAAAAPVAPPIAGGAWEGLRTTLRSPFLVSVAVYLAFATLTGAYAYNVKSELSRAAFPDRAARTAAFGVFESVSGTLTVVAQLLLTPWLLRRFGAKVSLVVLPFVHAAGATLIGFRPEFLCVAWYDAVGRAARHGVTTPTRESLFTAVLPVERYQAKAFIDTVVYRGGDVVAAWIYAFARATTAATPSAADLPESVRLVSFAVAPIGIAWWFVARRTARLAPAAAAAPAPR
jgi:AAA family ATP:ADP antiporter